MGPKFGCLGILKLSKIAIPGPSKIAKIRKIPGKPLGILDFEDSPKKRSKLAGHQNLPKLSRISENPERDPYRRLWVPNLGVWGSRNSRVGENFQNCPKK